MSGKSSRWIGRETAPVATRAGRILVRLRGIAKKMWHSYREALQLESEIVAIVGEATRGESTLHHGTRSQAVWEDVLDGTRRALLGDLCRIFVSSRPKGLDAADRVLELLAARRGKTVVEIEVEASGVGEALARVAREAGDVLAAGGEALADGKVDAVEAEILETQVHELESELVRLRMSLREKRRSIPTAVR